MIRIIQITLLGLAAFFFFPGQSKAESIAATPVPPTLQNGWIDTNGGGQYINLWYSSAVPPCNRYASAMGWAGGGLTTGYSSYPGQQFCYNTAWGPDYRGTPIPTGQSCAGEGQVQKTSLAQCATTYTCPANQNYTLTGSGASSSCVRPDCNSAAGETRNQSTGVCEVPCKTGQTKINGVCTCDNGAQTGTDGSCCPVAGSGGGAPMQWCSVSGPGATSCDSGGSNGCKVRCNNVTYQTGKGDQLQVYPKMALGQGCSYTGTKSTGIDGGPMTDQQLKEVDAATKNPEVAKTPEGCLASGQGYITSGGVTSCVSSGEGGKVVATKTGAESETVKNPSTGANETTTKETAKTETTNEDGTKATSTSTTKTNPDGTKEITTTTKTQNPDGTVTETTKTEKVAADGTKTTQSEKTGTEETGSWCEKNPNDPICKKESDDCKLYPDRIGCSEFGILPSTPDLDSETRGVSAITPVNLAENSICPVGVTLPKGLGAYDYQPMCDAAIAWKPIILALAWLSAFFIVMGYGSKEE